MAPVIKQAQSKLKRAKMSAITVKVMISSDFS